MIKVNTFKKRSEEIYANRPKNQGGFLGGAQYLGASLLAGIGGIGEGITDALGALAYDITGQHDKAEGLFKNNVVGDWYRSQVEEFNPDGVMNFLGDVTHGVGQSAYLFIPYAGAPLFYTGIVSQGISSAAEKTGDVGLKEVAYGGTVGALEGIIDKALGGTASGISKAVKGIGKNAGKNTGKTLFKATTDASRKGLMRKVFSSAASEFAEEFASEYADTFVQRAYLIDPDKQYSFKDAVYSGFVGFTSGAVTTSLVEIPRSVNYNAKGRSIIDRGNSQTLVNTATVVADKLANKGTDFKNAAGWVTALRGQVDAYNKLVQKGQGDSASAATILGEMQAYLAYAETKAAHAGLTERIKNASEADKEALAEYINMIVDKKNRTKDYTAQDITNNTDEIASQLAIMQFAGMALNYDAISEDVTREQEINTSIEDERKAQPAEPAADMNADTAAAMTADTAFDAAINRAEETPAQTVPSEPSVADEVLRQDATDIESSAAPINDNIEGIKGKIKAAVDKIAVGGALQELSENNLNEIAQAAQNNIRQGMNETDALSRAVAQHLTEVNELSSGYKMRRRFGNSYLANVKGAIINEIRRNAQSEAEKAAETTKISENTETRKSEETATDEKNAPKAEAKTEAPKQQNKKAEEKSSERKNESSESRTKAPKVSEAKESLTDEQRAERARKRAEMMLEWEKNNTPTVKEMNTAREYVKGFDNLSPERRQAIIRMIRTAKGVDVKTVKGIANLLAIKAGTDLDLRFDPEVSEYGVTVKSGGKTLIVISTKADFKTTVKGTVAHELVHYLENKPGYKTFAEHVMKRVKPEKKKEVEKEVTELYSERYEQIYREEYSKQGLRGAELDKAVTDALNSAEHKAIIDSEVVARIVGEALNSDKFLSRYARIGNTDGFIKKAWTFLSSMVKELKNKGDENNDLVDVIMPTIKSMDRLLQMNNAKDGVDWVKKYSEATPEQIAEWKKPITLQDIETLRSIGRKSVNNFDSAEIKKSQKWAYKFYNELGAKSPFFRAWFGEWRAHDDKTKVSVVKIPDTATENQRSLDGVVVKDTQRDGKAWKVVISGHGERNTRGHSGEKKKSVAGLTNIKGLVENAVLFNTEVHEHHDNNAVNDYVAFDHKLYSLGVNETGSIALYRITVEEYYQDWRHPDSKRFHNLKYVEEVAQIPAKKAADNLEGRQDLDESRAVSFDETSATTYSIADLYGFVKTFDKEFSPAPEVSKYVLNEDGTPKVFYHGTRAKFDTFELQDKPKFGRALGNGFYFTSSYDKAFKFANGLFSKGQDRGGIIMPVYLKMQNPYIITADADRTKWANEYHKGNYDGIIDLKNDTYYVEGQTQIKSATDNRGTFDKNNPNIKYSLAPKESQMPGKETAPKVQKQYSIAPKAKRTNPDMLNENGEISDPYFEQAVERMYANDLQMAEEMYESAVEEMQQLQMRIDFLEKQNDAYSEGDASVRELLAEERTKRQALDFKVSELKKELRLKDKEIKSEKNKTYYQKQVRERYAKQLEEEQGRYHKLLEEGTRQKNYDFIEIFELRSRLRELGYDFEQEKKKAEKILEQNKKQKEMLKDAKRENRDIIHKMEREVALARSIAEFEKQNATYLAKRLAQQRASFGTVYSTTNIKQAIKNIVDGDKVSDFFEGKYQPEITNVSANQIAEYISIYYNADGAEGESAKHIISVAAADIVKKMKYVDAESGEAKYLEKIVDKESYERFVADVAADLAKMIETVGEVNPYAKLSRAYERKVAQYAEREHQSEERKAYGEQLPKTYQEALKMRKLEKRGAAGFSENIEALAKKFAGLVDESGHLHLSRIDDAMKALSTFIAEEDLKNATERTQSGIDNKEKMTDFASDDAMLALLKALVENYQHNRLGTNPSQMQTAEDLKNVEQVIKALRKYVEGYGKEYFDGHYVDSVALAEQAVKNAFKVSKSKEYKTKVGEILGTGLKKLGNEYFYRILTPETVIESLEGFEKDAVLTKLYHQIRVASDKRNTMAMRMTKPFVEFFESKEHHWHDKGLPMSYSHKLKNKMISVNGIDIRLDDAIYLYCVTKDPDSYAGLAENGFVTHNKDGQREHTIKIEDPGTVRSNIANQFDEVDVEFVKLVEKFFNDTATKIKYDADVKIFGVSNNRNTYYIPIYRYKYARMRNVADSRASIAETITVFNKSFTHNRVANNTAIESSGIANIIYTHANSIADYSELYLPLKTFDRIYNRAVPTEDGEIRSVRDIMNNKVWKGTDTYLRDLFKDIQGQSEKSDNAIERAVGAMRGYWVSSLLGANLKVCTTQLTSLVSATQVINPKYITMASTKIATPDKELAARADKFSDIIEDRSFDNDALKAQGNVQVINKIGKFTGKGIDIIDRQVCLTIFHAAELQVQAQNGHAVGTEENSRLAAKLADDTIRATQSMSDTAEKSALQRSKSEIAKLFSMFTSDTVKNLSHAYGNIMKYTAHKRRAADSDGAMYKDMLAQDVKDLRRSARTLLLTGAVLGLISQGFKWLYDELEDDPEERQKDFAFDMISSTLNIFPVVSDFVDKLVFGYDMSLNVLDVANDTLDAVSNSWGILTKSMNGEYVSDAEIQRTSANFGVRFISFFGIPIEPAERTITGILRHWAPSVIYNYDATMYGTSYTTDLKKAVESGDADLAEYVLERLYKDEMAGTYTTPELEEIVRLYTLTDEDGEHYNVLPKKTLRKMEDGTELKAAQRKQFNSIYSQASAKVNELIRSAEYQTLNDEQKAKAIKRIYDLYYNRAAAEVAGKEWSNAQAYSQLTSNYSALFSAQAYKSGLEEYKDERGNVVTVKDQFEEYLKSLNLSETDYLVVAYANGYKSKKNKKALIEYINSLGLSEDVKKRIAEILDFSYENGKVIEKKDE